MNRKEMMSFKNRDEMRANHRTYYGEIVDHPYCNAKGLVTRYIGVDRVRAALDAGDEHLNTIQLHQWDALVSRLKGATHLLQERGDYLSLGTGVCILKEAARRLIEESKNAEHSDPHMRGE